MIPLLDSIGPWPLMEGNISRDDLDEVIAYLSTPDPRLTCGEKVARFEEAWAEWVGSKGCVFVNSGSSANDLTMLALQQTLGPGEIILSPLGWVSDVSAVVYAGMTPRFIDIDPKTLSIDLNAAKKALSDRTKAVLAVHILGLPGFTESFAIDMASRGIKLIEDTCESHGAMIGGRRCGSVGFASNFSFYYAHHLSTIEGGAICSDDEDFLDHTRMLRGHGLLRESRNQARQAATLSDFPSLNPDFVFPHLGRNNRPTELQAVIGLSQLRRLDDEIDTRKRNFALFLENLDDSKFWTHFDIAHSSNYALILVLTEADSAMRERIEATLAAEGIEFRRGLSGGGSQLLQPYARELFPEIDPKDFPVTNHVHSFGWYIGNYPGLSESRIERLAHLLNRVGTGRN